jgi:hypothetical protein
MSKANWFVSFDRMDAKLGEAMAVSISASKLMTATASEMT